MFDKPMHNPVAGIHHEDIARFDRALDGVAYPARKWQLIAHAGRDHAGRGGADPRTIGQLWALPAGHYTSVAQVLAAAARTARGHPTGDRLEPGQGRPAYLDLP